MPDDLPKQNTGLIEGSGIPGLWIAGTIPYEVRLQSGDWRPFLVQEEKQYSDNVDTMGCVSFSLNNDLEIQNKFLGVDVNYSDRFLAKISGTTTNGNYLDAVAYFAKNVGLVNESEWPAPPNYNWASYYAEIPQDVKNKAVKQNIAYEAVPTDTASLLYHLKQCPLQITIPKPQPNHAVVLVHVEGDTAYYFDTYAPYLKTINVNRISYALKIVLKGNPMEIVQIDNGPGLAIKNYEGKYLPISTSPEMYPAIEKALGLKGQTFRSVSSAEVNANIAGSADAGLLIRPL